MCRIAGERGRKESASEGGICVNRYIDFRIPSQVGGEEGTFESGHTNLNGTDFSSGTKVRATASTTVVRLDFDDPKKSGARTRFSESGCVVGAPVRNADGSSFGDQAIGAPFHLVDDRIVQLGGGNFNRRGVLPHVEAQGFPSEELYEDGREEMLSGMLLHVIVPPVPVDATFHSEPGESGCPAAPSTR